jgi:CBS domain-containing protein
MNVRDLLKAKNREIVTIKPDNTIAEAIEAMQMIIDNKIGALPVVDGDELHGIVSERDMFRAIFDKHEAGMNLKVSEIMTKNIVIGFPNDDVENVLALMTNNRFRHLPIMEDKKLIGIVSIGDVVAAKTVKLKVENHYLKDYIAGKYPA